MLQTSPKWAKWPRGQKENRGAVLEVIPPPIWVLPAESLDIMEQEKKKKKPYCACLNSWHSETMSKMK